MVPECRHIKTSGGKCGSPALRSQPYCYFHTRHRERVAQQPSFLPDALANLEDRSAIQHAITQVAVALADHRLDTKRASILLYALQIASGNAKDSGQIVSSSAIEEFTRTDQGEELAPEGATAGPPPEETLASLLFKEVMKRRQQNQELSSDQPPDPTENKELNDKSEGEGEGWVA